MLERLLADDPGACIIVITAHSGIKLAVAAMQAGARDFVMKPWRNAELIAKIEVAARAVPSIPPHLRPPWPPSPPACWARATRSSGCAVWSAGSGRPWRASW